MKMLTNSEGWLLAILSVSVIWLVLLFRRGPVAALGVGMVLSFLFPTWIKATILGIPFGVSTTMACITLMGYSMHRDGKIISPLTLLDISVALMFLTHVLADSIATGLTLALPFEAYGEWYLPYLAGRFAVRSDKDVRSIASWVIGVLMVLSVASVYECVSGLNPFESIFGNRPVELAGRNAQRLGFKRAFGPTTHPIYFGMLIAVLTPWLVSFWQLSRTYAFRSLAFIAGAISLAGAVGTVSRTPILTILGSAIGLLVVRFRAIRWPILITTIAVVTGFLLFPDKITDTVSQWTGGGDRLRVIEVDGKETEFSSSRSRLVLITAYSKALIKGGLTGYGSEAVSQFPPKIPYMQGKAEASEILAVDNAYILTMLRFGWLGAGCFVLTFITAIFSATLLHNNKPDDLFPAATASMLFVASTFSFLLVWMSYDFGFEILWTCGILSGLVSSSTRRRRAGNAMG
jgi:hypothetical protein